MKASLLLVPVTCALLLLTACFQGEQSSVEIDPPDNAEAVNDTVGDGTEQEVTETDETETEEETSEAEASTETVGRELYLIDANGLVASQVIELPALETKEVATQVLEYLVVDGPINEVLPNGFRAVLPAGTEILGVNLQEDGSMIVDLSEEFKDYRPEDEVKIIESMTHTLTQFENVERVKLWINGHPLEEMPVNGTPIEQGYSRAHGINVTQTDTIDFINSQAVTMYYPVNNQEQRYYIPMTQYIESDEDEMIKSIVTSLLDGPGSQSVMQVFNSQAMLVEEPVLSDGVLELTFNEAILMEEGQAVIADEAMETLVRTLTSQEAVEAVHINVENVETILNENGESYSEPVTTDLLNTSERL